MPASVRGSGASSPTRDKGRGLQTKLLKDVLELEPVRTKDGQTRYTIRPVEESLNFEKGFYVFVRALQLLKGHNDGVILVGLGGASGSGKTAFGEKIKSFMPGVVVISMDMYNDGSKVVDQNFDDPRLTDYDTLLANLSDLRAGKTTQVPIYDFKTSTRVGYNTTPPPASRVVILEGIYALNEKLRPLLDLRVSITGGVHFDLIKRVMRDIKRAGQGPEAIIQQVTETVYPMYKAFIEPDLQTAQLRIFNAFNPFSGFLHPTYILKSGKVPDLELIRTTLKAHGTVTEVQDKDLADIYLLPPGEDPETCQTWLRMRNKDGRYSLMFEEWVVEDPFVISPRITFEVSVKILGGLMALGYEIGTIMRRTSRIFKVEECDVTVKVDDVHNLGNFIQLLGRERERIAKVGHDLGLDGTYIARPYIEQVQLEQLTADFTAVTAEMRDTLTSGANNSGKILMDILYASPPARIPRRIMSKNDSSRRSEASGGSFSCSAPVDVLLPPSPGQLAAALARSGNATATNSFSTNSAGRPPMGLLHQQLTAQAGNGNNSSLPPPQSPALPPTRTQSGFSPAPQALQQIRDRDPHTPIQRPGSYTHLSEVQGNGYDSGTASISRAVDQLDTKLQRINASVSQCTDMKLQLDVLVNQYQATNLQLQQLSEATSALAASLQSTMSAVASEMQAARGQAQGALPSSVNASQFSISGIKEFLIPAGIAVVAACTTAAVLTLMSRKQGSNQ